MTPIEKGSEMNVAELIASTKSALTHINKPNIVELLWLEQAWDHVNWFELQVVPASQGRFLYL